MANFLFLQRFVDGHPVGMPHAEVLAALRPLDVSPREGTCAPLVLPPDEIASGAVLVFDDVGDVSCIAFERPRYDDALRQTVWSCMRGLGCTAFEDTLHLVCTPPQGAVHLPEGMRHAAPLGIVDVRDARQLWPAILDFPDADDEFLVAVPWRRAGDETTRLLYFDAVDEATQRLVLRLDTHPAILNPGTVGALREWSWRTHEGLARQGRHGLELRFSGGDAALDLLEAIGSPPQAVPVNIVTPFGTALPPPPPFVADRGVFASTRQRASRFVRDAREQHGIALDGSPESVEALAKLLDEAGADAPDALVVGAGCYLAELVRQHVGAQCGYVVARGRRTPALRTHSGLLVQPPFRVLSHLVAGATASVDPWLRQLLHAHRSPTPRNQDLANSIPGWCDILLGKADLRGGQLPMADRIPRAALDYTVPSLASLDGYLAQVAARREKLTDVDLAHLTVAAGAYLGDTIRSAAPRGHWQWTNYDDHAQRHPDFAQARPRTPGFLAFLDSAESTAYPLAQVAARLEGDEGASCVGFARELLGDGAAPPAPVVAAAPPPPTAATPAPARPAYEHDSRYRWGQRLVGLAALGFFGFWLTIFWTSALGLPKPWFGNLMTLGFILSPFLYAAGALMRHRARKAHRAAVNPAR